MGLGSDHATLLKFIDNLPKNGHFEALHGHFHGKIAATRSRIICVSNNDNHGPQCNLQIKKIVICYPQKHLWIICELQTVIINTGSEIG